MQGTVKWFNTQKGYGFIVDSEGKDVFVHHSNIVMDGFRHLNEDEIVNFELEAGKDEKKQAVNVQPILTRKMINDALKKENLDIQTMRNDDGVIKYMVINQLDVIQTGEQGMSLIEVAKYAGFEIVEKSA